ncbi:MAG TPA: PAS domain S-box protein [Spirochaetota bacterium]|nr:PAS domain S-box protein [Spirochaetota bacterium]
MKIERSIHVLYVYGPAILILFAHSLYNKKNRIIEAGAFLISFLISLFVFTDYYFTGLWEFNWGYIAKGGIVLQIFGIWGMSSIAYSLILSVKKLKTDIDDHIRLKIKYIMFGILAIGVLTLGNMFALNGIDVYPPGNFAFIPLLFMAWGIYRHDVIRINLYTKRRIIGNIAKMFAVTALLAAFPVSWWAIGHYTLEHIVSRTVPYGLPPLISFIVTVFLVFLSLRVGENRNDSIIFSFLMLVYALLSIDIYLNCIITIPETGLRVSRLSHLFVVFLPPLGMHLIRVVTNRRSERWLVPVMYLASVFLMVFTQSEYYLKDMYIHSWGLFARKAVFFDIVSFLGAVMIVYNLIILVIAYRRSEDSYYRRQFLTLLVGFISLAFLSLANIPVMNGHDFYPPGNFIFIPSILFAVALFRNNRYELYRLIGSFMYYGVIAVMVAAAVYCINLKRGDSLLPLYSIVLISVLLVSNYGIRQLRDLVTGIHGKKLKVSFEYLSDKLSRARTIDDIAGCVSHAFFNDLLCRHCTILFFEENENQYRGHYIYNTFCDHVQERIENNGTEIITIDAEHPLLSYIDTKYSIIKPDEIEYLILNNNLSIPHNDPIRRSEIFLPVFFENRLSAIILLGLRIDFSAYSHDEHDFLYKLGIILGPYIENARILQNLENTLDERTKELRSSEKKYRTLLQTNNVGFFELDLDGNVVSCNDIVLSFTGYGKEELIGMNATGFIHPDYIKKAMDVYHRVFTREMSIGSVEQKIIRKNGVPGFVDTTVSLITNDRDEAAGFRTIAIDITNRKAMEAALLESEKKYRHLIENTNEIIYKADWQGNFIYSNPAFQKKTEYTDEEILQLNYLDLIPPENRENEFRFYSGILENKLDESHRELPILTKTGKILWVEQDVKSIKDGDGHIREFDCIVHDITARKLAEDALRESEKNYQQLLTNVSDCVFICKFDGHFKYVNRAITRLVGVSQEEIIGRHFLSVVHTEYRERLMKFYMNQIKKNIETTYCEFPVLLNGIHVVWCGQTVRMTKNNEGEIEFYGITRDISDRKKEDDARRDLENAKSRFFSNVSHEIRTPLTLMLGPIESVLRGDYGKEIDNDFFRSLHRNTLNLLKLVNNLLDFSKIEAGKMTLRVQESDVVQFARQYLPPVKLAVKSKKINLEFNAPEGSIELFFDPEKMDKIFMNLISNALKFTGEGGTIAVTLEEHDRSCMIRVADTGEGISKDNVSIIFDRFSQADVSSTRKYEGTGIGLALVKELVELHGGIIEVESRHIKESKDNHGSVFTITIPKGMEHLQGKEHVIFTEKSDLDDYVKDYRLIEMNELDASQNDAASADEVPGVEGQLESGDVKTILIVDDNEDMRNYLKILLRKHYRLLFAEDGEKGLASARQHKPDLIVSDVMMPEMNGFDMTSIIKEDDELNATPVILLTADTDIMSKVTGLEHGADDYLNKPFNSLELLTRISSLLKNYENQKIISQRNNDIERELEVARLLQERLLPPSIPETPGFHGHAVYVPMDKIGGDFYDIENRDGFLNIIVADVSGHGLPGAFLATVTKIALDNINDRGNSSEVLSRLNDVVLKYTVQGNFVTAFFALIDTSTNVMRYSSAGHLPPLLYRKKNDEFYELNTKGTFLGWLRDIRIEEKTVQLETGDRVVFYTDGIIESKNRQNELYGEERLQEAIRGYAHLSAENFSQELMLEIELFNGDSNFDDDITMVVLDVL